MAIPKKAYLLSFFRRHYHRIMKLKCKAHRYLSLFSCNCVSHMTNSVNFKLSKDVEKNPGPTQYNTDHHEVIIRPFMQNHSSTMQLTSPISSENLMQSRLGELGLQSIDVGGAGDCFFRSVSHHMAIATIICLYVLLKFNLRERTQRDLLRAIPKIHGYDIRIICVFKVPGLMHLSFKQLQMH